MKTIIIFATILSLYFVLGHEENFGLKDDSHGKIDDQKEIPKEEIRIKAKLSGVSDDVKRKFANAGKDRISVYGFSSCPHFKRAVEMAQNSYKELPQNFRQPIIRAFADREQYQNWLRKSQSIPEGKMHRTSPFVWKNKGEFIGGGDNLFGFLADKYPDSKVVASYQSYYPPRK